MKKSLKTSCLVLMMTAWCCFAFAGSAEAKPDSDIISTGIYIEEMDVSGMHIDDAKKMVQEYVESLQSKEISLISVEGNEVKVTAGELGISWSNSNIVEEAGCLGTEGNIVKRFKDLKDLEHEKKVFDIEFAFDDAIISTVLSERCAKFNRDAVDASLKRENGKFVVQDGQTGQKIDEKAALEKIMVFLSEEWNHDASSIELPVVVDEPMGKTDDLVKVKDVLGSYTTSYKSSGKSRSENIANGTKLINGITLYPGEEFSMLSKVQPFSEENGYYMAGSYLKGKVVDSLGGGICQVSTTLYNAVLLSEFDVSQRYNHSMSVSYVQPSADAAIAESADKDFKFINNTDYPIYIEGITGDKSLTFNIYGVEYRPANRTISFESEVLSETHPEQENIVVDSGQPVGYVSVQSAHVGVKAKLWKIVKEDGEIVSKTEINTSSYAMSPRTATVGVSTTDPITYATIQGAIQSGSIDNVRNVAAAIKAQNQALADMIKAQEAIAAQAQVEQ